MGLENEILKRPQEVVGAPEVDLTGIETLNDFFEKYQDRIKERIAQMSPAQLSTFMDAVASYGWEQTGEGSNGESNRFEINPQEDGNEFIGLTFEKNTNLMRRICHSLNLQCAPKNRGGFGQS